MKFSSKEEQILLVVTVAIGLYDFFTIPLNSLLIALIFSAVFYGLTESLFIVSLILIVPQVIKMMNSLVSPISSMISHEGMNNVDDITKRITGMVDTYSKEEKSSKEGFDNLLDISKRVEDLQKNVQPKAEVSGVVDDSPPTGVYPIEGNPSYPKFNEERIGTSIDTNASIYTASESSVPATGTVNSLPKQNPYVPKFDELGLSAALARSSGNTTNASNIKGM